MGRWAELRRLLGAPDGGAPDRRWDTLRGVLLGRDPGDHVDLQGLAEAARHGEVPTLAAASHPALGDVLKRAARRQVFVDMSLELALDRVARVLEREGLTRVALLKGSATAYTLYDAPHHRVRRDIDLLVSDADMAEILRALLADGWRSDLEPKEAAKGPLGVRAWPLVLDLPIGALSCDVHRRLTHGDRFAVDVEGILQRRRQGEARLPVAAPEDLFLHTCLHLATNGFHEPLKAWMDLVLLLGPRGRVDRQVVAARARRWGAKTAVWSALLVLDRWFGVDEPGLRRATRPSAARAAALRWLLAGSGCYPLRQDVDKATATAATALLVTDSPAASLAWLQTALARRLGA